MPLVPLAFIVTLNPAGGPSASGTTTSPRGQTLASNPFWSPANGPLVSV